MNQFVVVEEAALKEENKVMIAYKNELSLSLDYVSFL